MREQLCRVHCRTEGLWRRAIAVQRSQLAKDCIFDMAEQSWNVSFSLWPQQQAACIAYSRLSL